MDDNLIEQDESKKFGEKITNIHDQFFSALDDYKKYYVYYNKNPEVNEFQNYYANSKSQIQNISKTLILITNGIHKSIEILDKKMSTVGVKLQTEQKLNENLMKLYNSLENTQNGSEILIDDAKESYNTQYRYNWEMFIGLFIIGGVILKTFKPPVATGN
jgi:hypothetical protein